MLDLIYYDPLRAYKLLADFHEFLLEFDFSKNKRLIYMRQSFKISIHE